MPDLAGEILILTGSPGSGKTTTARAIAALPGSPKVHLHADDFWHFIGNGAIQPHLPEAHRQNGVVIDVLAGVVETYAGGGYFVVLDGIIGPWFLEPFTRIAVPLHYIVLRPPLDVAIKRCQKRGGDTLAEPGAIAMLHEQFSSLGSFQRHSLPVADLTPEATLEAVIDAVGSRDYLLSSGS